MYIYMYIYIYIYIYIERERERERDLGEGVAALPGLLCRLRFGQHLSCAIFSFNFVLHSKVEQVDLAR